MVLFMGLLCFCLVPIVVSLSFIIRCWVSRSADAGESCLIFEVVLV